MFIVNVFVILFAALKMFNNASCYLFSFYDFECNYEFR